MMRTYLLVIDNVGVEFLFVREGQAEHLDPVVDALLETDHAQLAKGSHQSRNDKWK